MTQQAVGRLLCLCERNERCGEEENKKETADGQVSASPNICETFRRVFFRAGPHTSSSDSAAESLGVSVWNLRAAKRPSAVLHGGFHAQAVSRADPLSLCCAALRLLLQVADVGDDVLNLGVGQLACVALHLAHAVFGLLEQVGVGGLRVFR